MRAHPAVLMLLICSSSLVSADFQLGDFNGDGRADMLLRDAYGEFHCSTSLTETDDASFSTVADLPNDLAWHVVALADFDGDNKTDSLLRHQEQGWSLALLDGCKLKNGLQAVDLDVFGPDVRIVSVADIDDDQKSDLILRDDSGGWSIAFMDGADLLTSVDDPSELPIDTQWRVIGIGDFDGNRIADILTRHVNGSWQLHSPSDESATAFHTRRVWFQRDTNWRDEATADFDGNGQTDLLLRHADGTWEIQTLRGNGSREIEAWDASQLYADWDWRTRATGDFEDNGRSELVLQNKNTGQWRRMVVDSPETTNGEGTDLAIDSKSNNDWLLPQPPVYVPDPAFRHVLELELDLNEGTWIPVRQLAALTTISHIAYLDQTLPSSITDLYGIRYAEGMTSLTLAAHEIKSIAPLIGLDISSLELDLNQISDITPLVGMLRLANLSLYGNVISDISVLVSLLDLRALDLSSNQIENVSYLIDLTQLEDLKLNSNPLNNIDSLATLTNLVSLYLNYTGIKDLSPLQGLTSLDRLSLNDNKIVDITPLASLNNVRLLYLSWNKISNIEALASMTGLRNLYMKVNLVEDITPLSNLLNLVNLNLSNNKISNVSALASLTELKILSLQSNGIVDISPLTALTNLLTLNLAGNLIKDIPDLSALTRLQVLNLSYNEITAINTLSNLTALTSLNLQRNQISDIPSLSTLTQLQTINLDYNNIVEIDPLLDLGNLSQVSLRANPLSERSQTQLIPQLKELGVAVDYVPTSVFRDSRGRSAMYSFTEEPTSDLANGVLIFIHGNAGGTSIQVLETKQREIERLAQENGLIAVLIASPEAFDKNLPWRTPNMNGNATRFWNYTDDVDLLHEMLQSDFGGKLPVDKDRVYFYGESQGTCFLHQFLKRWGHKYRGGMLAHCGCIDGGLDPLWHAERRSKQDFRVFVNATTGDYLHKQSRLAYDYYKFTLGLESSSDLDTAGMHCSIGEVSTSAAVKWLITGEGLNQPAKEPPHFSRVSLADRVVGLATDANGALWFVQQERTGANPSASLWRSVDRGTTFELAGRHPYEVYDLDIAGQALFLTTANAQIQRSLDQGRTFDAVHVATSTGDGWIKDASYLVLGWPYKRAVPVLISTRNDLLLLLAGRFGDEHEHILISDDLGESWRTESTPERQLGDHVFGPDPLILDEGHWNLWLAQPIKWLASNAGLDWREIPKMTTPLVSIAWDGTALLGFGRSDLSRTWWTAADATGSWREKPMSEAVIQEVDSTDYVHERLTALGQGDVLLFGGGGEGHLYNGHTESWRHIRGGNSIGRPVHKVAVDLVRGDVYVTDSRGIFRLNARFREGAADMVAFTDSDSDQIPDALDAFPSDETEYMDSDKDGIGNYADTDDDGDGVTDQLDGAPLDAGEFEDLDLDALGDRADNDKDGDGMVDSLDWFPLDPQESFDTDGDGQGDWVDQDDDNDGVNDYEDAFPRYVEEYVDSDGDNLGDVSDPDPESSTIDSPMHLTAALGNWINTQASAIELGSTPFPDVSYPKVSGDRQHYGRLHVGEQLTTEIHFMLSTQEGSVTQLLHFDRNGDKNLTNDGPPLLIEAGWTRANWYEAWVFVNYASGISLPYHMSTYKMRVSTSSETEGKAWLFIPASGRATLATLPDGPSVSLVAVDANGNAVFTDEDDYICLDVDQNNILEGCGKGGAEQFPYGMNVVVDDVEYAIETVPSGYTVSIERVSEETVSASRPKHTTATAKQDAEILREQAVTRDVFYSPLSAWQDEQNQH